METVKIEMRVDRLLSSYDDVQGGVIVMVTEAARLMSCIHTRNLD